MIRGSFYTESKKKDSCEVEVGREMMSRKFFYGWRFVTKKKNLNNNATEHEICDVCWMRAELLPVIRAIQKMSDELHPSRFRSLIKSSCFAIWSEFVHRSLNISSRLMIAIPSVIEYHPVQSSINYAARSLWDSSLLNYLFSLLRLNTLPSS